MKTTLLFIFVLTTYFIQAQCYFSTLNLNTLQCYGNDVYDISGTVEFSGAPLTGTLTVTVDNGSNQYDTIIQPPFTSPQSFSISNIPADASSSSVTAVFTDDIACTLGLNFTAPSPCYCFVDAGTYSDTYYGSSVLPGVLVWGDRFDINTNNDFTYHTDLSSSGLDYDPGLGYLVYACEPTLSDLAFNDTCLLGLASLTAEFIDTNNTNRMLDLYSSQYISRNTLYYMPLPFYNLPNNVFAVNVNNSPWCYDYGEVFPITYLDSISAIATPDPANGQTSFLIDGGYPAFFTSNYTISNLLPATASIDISSVPASGVVTISGLTDQENYYFEITDEAGSFMAVGGMYLEVEKNILDQVTIYPNPTQHLIHIEGIVQSTVITIKSIEGKDVYTQETCSPMTIDSNFLPSGIYWIELKSEGNRRVQKIIKE